jgi:hypothetical protein
MEEESSVNKDIQKQFDDCEVELDALGTGNYLCFPPFSCMV